MLTFTRRAFAYAKVGKSNFPWHIEPTRSTHATQQTRPDVLASGLVCCVAQKSQQLFVFMSITKILAVEEGFEPSREVLAPLPA